MLAAATSGAEMDGTIIASSAGRDGRLHTAAGMPGVDDGMRELEAEKNGTEVIASGRGMAPG